jgi:glyoxylate/hydroxypyruvate reductase A
MALRISLCYPGVDLAPWLEGLRSLLPGADVTAWQSGAPPADYGVVWAPPQQFVDEQARIKAVFNIGAGVDKLLQLRLPTHWKVVRLDDAGMGVQMAEYVCHAVIRHFRDFEAYATDQHNARWTPREPRSRAAFSVGLLGLGVLGSRVAQALRAFEFPLLGWSRTPKNIEGVQCHHGAAGLQDFLAGTQLLVNLLPLTAETENLLDRDTLGRLRPGGYLVNVARGAHLVEEDLLALLETGQLAGATLDVFRTEPLPPGHPFWHHPRITVTPHVSARTLRDASIAQIARKIRALQRGEPIAGVVDPVRGY